VPFRKRKCDGGDFFIDCKPGRRECQTELLVFNVSLTELHLELLVRIYDNIRQSTNGYLVSHAFKPSLWGNTLILPDMNKLLVAILVGLTPLVGLTRECTRDEAYAAETVVDYLNSWENVHLFYQQFRHCYDAAIAEGVQDRVQVLWADRWSELPKMVLLTQKDPQFKEFVLRSLFTEAFPKDRFDKILLNASQKCPAAGLSFCAEVKRAAKINHVH